MISTAKAASPLAAAINAAREFKLLLDVQPAGALFNPGGEGDARASVTYALASLSLAEAAWAERHSAQPADMVHRSVSTVVDHLMEVAFGRGRAREKRSTAYMEGARSYLEHRVTGTGIPCQYGTGTAEFDAYFAGLNEGREVWRTQLRKEPA